MCQRKTGGGREDVQKQRCAVTTEYQKNGGTCLQRILLRW